MPHPGLAAPVHRTVAIMSPPPPPSWVDAEKQKRKEPESPSSGDQDPPVPETPIDISGVPELKDGTLDVGSDIDYPPLEFFPDGAKSPEGLDMELATALAQKLGVQVRFHDTEFGKLTRALKGKRFDIIMSAMTITEERRKEIEFISYFATGTMGTGILVPQGNPRRIRQLPDLCGLKVAVQKGTVQADEIESTACARKLKIDLSAFDRNSDALARLRQGRVDALLLDIAAASYAAAQSDGELEVAPNKFQYAPYGIGIRKDSTRLNEALTRALSSLNSAGTFDEILKRWGI